MTVAIDMIVEEVSEPIRYNSNSKHIENGGKIDVFVQVFPGSEGASVPRARAILQSAADRCQGELLTHFAGPLPLPSKCLLPKTLLPGGTAPLLSSFPPSSMLISLLFTLPISPSISPFSVPIAFHPFQSKHISPNSRLLPLCQFSPFPDSVTIHNFVHRNYTFLEFGSEPR